MRTVLFHKIQNMSAVSNVEWMRGKPNVTESVLVEIMHTYVGRNSEARSDLCFLESSVHNVHRVCFYFYMGLLLYFFVFKLVR
jgi:hypothetical protein